MDESLRQLVEALEGTVDNLVLFEAVDSTHALAVRLMHQMDDEGLSLSPTAIIALMQSGGQGRGERTWSSPPGGLYLSWASSQLDADTVGRLPIAAAAAACSALIELGIGDIGIKWPNDLVIGDGKLGGLLVHARHGDQSWATVGLGINLASAPELDDSAFRPATSVAEHLPAAGSKQWLPEIARGLVTGLNDAIANPAPATRLWRERLIHSPGETMQVRMGSGSNLQGTFAGVTDDGYLRLTCTDGERIISSGDVIE